MVDISNRTSRLKEIFSLTKKSVTNDTRIEIIPFSFVQKDGDTEIEKMRNNFPEMDFCSLKDDSVFENKHFKYIVFNPEGMSCSKNAILLLHGLNERTWDKYLTWAEDLSNNCKCPVILFPISFHMNRTPSTWYAPRAIMPWASKRKELVDGLKNSSFFNLALSSRLTNCPSRFYISGRESIYNIHQLISSIRQGENPLLDKGCKLDLFAYSIGCLLSQVLLMSDEKGDFSESKLFAFCGGSIFEDMNGDAKDIMDQKAFNTIREYYLKDFIKYDGDAIHNAFKSMISTEIMKEERESFYSKAKNRIKMVTLKRDVVIPTYGAYNAVGASNSDMIEELDFPFDYNHQIPFPTTGKAAPDLIYSSFRTIFDKAEAFIGI